MKYFSICWFLVPKSVRYGCYSMESSGQRLRMICYDILINETVRAVFTTDTFRSTTLNLEELTNAVSPCF